MTVPVTIGEGDKLSVFLPDTPISATPQRVLVQIGPTLAKAWLVYNSKNRPLSRTVVMNYARDILAKQWQRNGAAILFAYDGVLLDGQHRLAAIVEAEMAIITSVEFGLSPEAFKTIDTHKKRTAATFLALAGHPRAKTLAAAIANVISYERGNNLAWGRGNNYTHDEIEKALEKNPQILESLERSHLNHHLIAPGLSTALHYLASRHGGAKSHKMWEQLDSGIGLEGGSPIYQLRERLLANKQRIRNFLPLSAVEVAALVIKTFNLFVQDKRVVDLRWKNRNKPPEKFPRFIDLD